MKKSIKKIFFNLFKPLLYLVTWFFSSLKLLFYTNQLFYIKVYIFLYKIWLIVALNFGKFFFSRFFLNILIYVLIASENCIYIFKFIFFQNLAVALKMLYNFFLTKFLFFWKTKFGIFLFENSMSLKFVFYSKFFITTFGFFFWDIYDSILLWFSDPTTRQEIQSFAVILGLTVFTYYFILIECGTILFGYSLICYRYAFITAFFCLVCAWWFDVIVYWEVIDDEHVPKFTDQEWLNYYEGSTPFSFYDFLNDYENKEMFKYLMEEAGDVDLDENWSDLNAFYIFVVSFSFIYIAFAFNPKYFSFAARYFQPYTWFWESRALARRSDFLSAPIRLWAWIVAYYIYKNATGFTEKGTPIVPPWLRKRLYWFPAPPKRFYLFADLQWRKKISFWPDCGYQDIWFLGHQYKFFALRRLLFKDSIPSVMAQTVDQNWNLLFLRYLRNQFRNDGKQTFWSKNFTNDIAFWNMCEMLKKDHDLKLNMYNKVFSENFSYRWSFAPTFEDTILSMNYLDSEPFSSLREANNQGWNLDYSGLLQEFELNNLKSDSYDDDFLKPIFSTTWINYKPQTITDFFKYLYKSSNFQSPDRLIYNKFNEFYQQYNFFLKNKDSITTETFKTATDYSNDTPLEYFMLGSDLNFESKSWAISFIWNSQLLKFFKYHVSGADYSAFPPNSPERKRWLTEFEQGAWFFELVSSIDYWLSKLEKLAKMPDKRWLIKWKRLMNPANISNRLDLWLYELQAHIFKNYAFKDWVRLNLPLWFEASVVKQVGKAIILGTYSSNMKDVIQPERFIFWPHHFMWLIKLDAKLWKLEFMFEPLNKGIQLKLYKQQEDFDSIASWENLWNFINVVKQVNSEEELFLEKNIRTVKRYRLELNTNKGYIQKTFLWWKNWIDAEPGLKLNSQNHEILPWYMRSLDYFNSYHATPWQHAPGWVSFFYPTPYPGVLSSFGKFLYWILGYQHNYIDKHTTAISFVELGNKASLPIMTSVFTEIYHYISNFFEPVRIVCRYFIYLLNSFIIYLSTSRFSFLGDNLVTLIFFLHIKWFLYYYIYGLVIIFLLHYIFKYYVAFAGVHWNFLTQFFDKYLFDWTSWIYWYNISELWTSFRTMEHVSIFKIQTSLLFHLSMWAYTGFICFGKTYTIPLTSIFIKMASKHDLLRLSLSDYAHQKLFQEKKKTDFDLWFFHSFFNIYMKKYTLLLYEGGSDVSPDNLIWSYYNYLSQVSIWVSRGLWRNMYKINKNSWLLNLMKTFTIAITSAWMSTDTLFLSMPALDTQLNWTLIKSILWSAVASFRLLNDKFVSPYFYSVEDNRLHIAYGLLCGYKTEMFNLFNFSGYSIYSLFNANTNFLFLSKINTTTFWNDPKYWLFAFFWSFRFISKNRFPHLNIYSTHELTRIQLAQHAYANSWLGYTMYMRPFSHTIHHLWWTSKFHSNSIDGIIQTYNLNFSNDYNIVQVRNFLGKRYSIANSKNTEFIFGRSLWIFDIPETILTRKRYHVFWKEKDYEIENSIDWLNLTYTDSDLKYITSPRDINKAIPPLDLSELGITPQNLLTLFDLLPQNYKFLYLSFLSQLQKSTYLKQYFTDIDLESLQKPLAEAVNKKSVFKENFFSVSFLKEDLANYDMEKVNFSKRIYSSRKNLLKEWIFGFDTSYFFSHFMTWDFFTDSTETKWPWKVNFSQSLTTEWFLQQQAFADIVAELYSVDHWSYKPLGVLNKLESLAMRRYKQIKLLDISGMPKFKIDPYAFYEWELYSWEVGMTSLNMENAYSIRESYVDEQYPGQRDYDRFPYNTSLTQNKINPILLGWVGELTFLTTELTNMYFSATYAPIKPSLDAWKSSNSLITMFFSDETDDEDFFQGEPESFTARSFTDEKLFTQLYTWSQLILAPAANWYSFGPKASAWIDHWSWWCGLELDYWNGFFSYWPYSGLWHSFGTKISIFDPTYGNYRAYRQLDENPFMIDFTTDAMNMLIETLSEEEEFFSGLYENDLLEVKEYRSVWEYWEQREKMGIEDEMVWEHNPILKKYSKKVKEHVELATLDRNQRLYWETYYCFHHPYFLGFFMYWYLLLISNDYFNGLANFSYRWFLINKIWNQFSELENFDNFWLQFSQKWIKSENVYWKYIFRYWMYWANPIKITNNFFLRLDYGSANPVCTDLKDYSFNVYWSISNLFSFLNNNLNLSANTLTFVSDVKRNSLLLLRINFLNLEMPFCLNPFLVTLNSKSIFSVFDPYIQHQKIFPNLQLCQHDTLKENFNTNAFFDWSTGVYMDPLNFSSYYPTYRVNSGLGFEFFDTPNWLAYSTVQYLEDRTEQVAKERYWVAPVNTILEFDIILANGLLISNLSLLHFLTSSFQMIIEAAISDWPHTINLFFNLYGNSSFFKEFFLAKATISQVVPESKLTVPLKSILTPIRHRLFLYKLFWWVPLDTLNLWINLGIFLHSKKTLAIFYKSVRLRIFIWFYFCEQFYWRIGYALSIFLKKKKIIRRKSNKFLKKNY